jgi:uncharacterized repeat protein (TIGR01451 family)
MRSVKLFLSIVVGLNMLSHTVQAQNGYIYSPVGNGIASFSGDGGHASQAGLYYPTMMARDNDGNIYFPDRQNFRIRRVDAVSGNISTAAGTGTQGYSGDGGLAVNADLGGNFGGICTDASNNVYFFDSDSSVIRKIDVSTGIITRYAGNGNNWDGGNNGLAINASFSFGQGLTVSNGYLYFLGNSIVRRIDLNTDIVTAVAGNGNLGYTGDGGLAVNALLGLQFGIACDAAGDVYLSDNTNSVIRKIDMGTGIINTICGNGQPGMAVDGIPAITAQLNGPWDIEFDVYGNLVIADLGNGRIRRINMATGIINNIAGVGTYTGSTDEAIPALTARVDPRYLCVDRYNNILLTEAGGVVRKITADAPVASIAADSFAVEVFHECNNTQFVAVLPQYTQGFQNTSAYSVKTFYGDGQDNTHSFVGRNGGHTSIFDYNYALSGNYQIKHVLFNGANAVDSVQYTMTYSLCRSVTAKLYLDGNGDCSYDPFTESYLSQVATISVDSNNVTIDTISALGGFTYNTFGDIGDVYKFTVLDLPLGLQTSCPVNGIVTDTIQTNIYTNTRYIGTECGTGSAFDLSVDGFLVASGISLEADIIVHNTYCNPQNAVVTMTFSPKYEFVSALPVPTAQAGNVITWTLNASDFTNFLAYLHVSLQNANNQIVMPGDTVHTTFSVTPTTGDIDPSNNVETRVDTVTGPYDPNAVYVSPDGCISAGDMLTYTVTFENMGNAPAQEVYIMDTLNNNVDMQTVHILASSHTMNVTKVSSGSYNILKFEFPAINLPDSSHHDECQGMVKYTVNTKSTMSLSDVVTNKAGIFFDYMPAVLTNVAQTTICQPQFVNTVYGAGKVAIFPNPAYNELTVKGGKELTSCAVLNQTGQVVLEKDMKDGKAELNIKHLPAGLYFVNVKGANGSETYKFVKM